MGRKVIFLDVDGVLNTERYITIQNKNNDPDPVNYDRNFDPIVIKAIKKLYDNLYDPIIVLSSTWRISNELFDYVKKYLNNIGILTKPKLYKTDILKSNNREEEIIKFIKENNINIKDIVIIDDESWGMKQLNSRLILCDQYYGFNNEKLKEALKLFNIN